MSYWEFLVAPSNNSRLQLGPSSFRTTRCPEGPDRILHVIQLQNAEPRCSDSVFPPSPNGLRFSLFTSSHDQLLDPAVIYLGKFLRSHLTRLGLYSIDCLPLPSSSARGSTYGGAYPGISARFTHSLEQDLIH